MQSPASSPRQGIKRTASQENSNGQNALSPISRTASSLSVAAGSGAHSLRTRSQIPPARSPGIQRTASAGQLIGQKVESPISRTASGGAAGSGLSLVRTRSAGIQRTASAGQLREQTVESPIHRTASGVAAGFHRTASGGAAGFHRTASGGAAGSRISFSADTDVISDIISRIASGGAAGAAVRSAQTSVRQTKSSHARAGLVAQTHLSKALAVVQNAGIQAARESLFSSSAMRVTKRSLSKAKVEVLQKDLGNEIKEAKGLDHILATALANSNLSGSILQQIIPEEAFTRLSSLGSDDGSKIVRMSSVCNTVGTGSVRSISSDATKDDAGEDVQGWWIGDVYNGRVGCDIFVGNDDFKNEDDEKGVTQSKKKKLLKGRITNTIDIKEILSSGSDHDDTDIGKAMGKQAFVSLMIGDWRAASDCIREFQHFTDEETAAAMSYKDHDGNTLFHMAMMEPENMIDVQEKEAKHESKVGIKFEDTTHQIIRENIIQVQFKRGSMRYDGDIAKPQPHLKTNSVYPCINMLLTILLIRSLHTDVAFNSLDKMLLLILIMT